MVNSQLASGNGDNFAYSNEPCYSIIPKSPFLTSSPYQLPVVLGWEFDHLALIDNLHASQFSQFRVIAA